MSADPGALRRVFDQVVALPPEDRATFLARACGDDQSLRREVERLLAGARAGASVVDGTQSALETTNSPLSERRATPTLENGRRLGPYEIVAVIGRGGMGEVYRARDTRLGRTVALKILAKELVADPRARHRFEREARSAAALAHPHICHLLDIGREGELDFLVLEFLEGETLAARLARGKPTLVESVGWAQQIVSALAAAHRAGIVHRDFKPGNVMLTPEGVMLLDFGLAKPRVPFVSGAAGIDPLTSTGTVLGTIQYMAPEQLEGREADERSDIFAFGAVLYELLAGHRAFEGVSHAAVIGQILHGQPRSLHEVDPRTPAPLDALVRRCLVKNPAGRFATFAEVRDQLLPVLADLESAAIHSASVREGQSRWSRRVWTWTAALGALCLAGIAIALWSGRIIAPVSKAPAIAGLAGAAERNLTRVTFDEGLQTDPVFSPDGKFVAYASDKGGNFDIYVQPLAGGDPLHVTRGPAHETEPDWSPDGTTIVYRSTRGGGGLYSIPAFGGPERKIVDFGFRPRVSPDSRTILFVDTEAFEVQRVSPNLFVVDASGGAPRRLTGRGWQTLGAVNAMEWHPDGRISILSEPPGALQANRPREGSFVSMMTMSADGTDALRSAIPDEIRRTLDACLHIPEFRWSPSGDRLFAVCQTATARNIWSIAVDRKTLGWTLPVERLITGAEWDHRLAVSATGALAFSNQHAATGVWQYLLDERSGRVQSAGKPVSDPGLEVGSQALSADGRTLFFTGSRSGARQAEFWRASLVSDDRLLLSRGATGRFALRLAEDGRLAWVQRDADNRFRLMWSRAAGEPARPLAESVGLILPFEWAASGDAVIGSAAPDSHTPFAVVRWAIGAAPHAESHVRVLLRDADWNLWNGRISPNRKWMCFNANAGRTSGPVSIIGVAASEGSEQRSWVHITPDAEWSDHPRWSRDGTLLYYAGGYGGSQPNVWVVPFDPETGRPRGPAVQVTEFDSPSRGLSRNINHEIDVRGGRLTLPITEVAGSIWTLDAGGR